MIASKRQFAPTAASQPKARVLRLEVIGGELGSQEMTLPLPARIGRSSSASLQLSHPLVADEHCDILVRGDQVLVRDLGSENGTFVNRDRIDLAQWEPGQLLTIGDVTFRAILD
ncbi:FHA domain-containing protein [Blastopirellula sp. JC732]|uniref:FHA domain-containing protein n=1 Tax=Blastopirellula sediminis TaxID=2894196 RepID=A0A9X1MQ42_9BACT|nr:FHA domain-containing protein [Blastopirellula sediminis]MCC9606310.1 FHA domain-containing protein [Blastopirellula sediminis]MCC9630392.1 FHA domain-containing protein [Blastopirellula sediminis]